MTIKDSGTLRKIIAWAFCILFLIIPLLFYPFTSEAFEFNKIVALYTFTTVLVSLWVARSILEKRFIFRRTFLDLPLLIFLGSQIISTLLSIDFATSLLGYYSRFNGGLASSLCYALLYWAFVSNIRKESIKSMFVAMFTSAFIVSIWGILEHFGHSPSCIIISHKFDTACWVQDVAQRVFATIGQPNWMGTYLAALIPLSWVPLLRSRMLGLKQLPSIGLSLILFLALLFTKSRSSFLGLCVGTIVFLFLLLLKVIKEKNQADKNTQLFAFAGILFSLVAICIIVGFPYSAFKTTQNVSSPVASTSPALESGGTESGVIRKIVWKGAIDIWKSYPIFGSGVETFAQSYYRFKPAEHNLTSEWDFLYNKAHNEYLNLLATTGIVGLASYLILILSMLFTIQPIIKKTRSVDDTYLESSAITAGFVAIIVSNFLGFSVVTVQIIFFLFPAIVVVLENSQKDEPEKGRISMLSTGQKVAIAVTLALCLFSLYQIGKYWYADYLFAKGKLANASKNYIQAKDYFLKAIKLSPGNPFFYDDLSLSGTAISLELLEEKRLDEAKDWAVASITASEKAITLSPQSVIFRKTLSGNVIRLSDVDMGLLPGSEANIIEAITLAPTDAKLFYTLGITYMYQDKFPEAVDSFRKAIDLKPNYQTARYTLAVLYQALGERQKAKVELEYIINNISPNDEIIKKRLNEINTKTGS